MSTKLTRVRVHTHIHKQQTFRCLTLVNINVHTGTKQNYSKNVRMDGFMIYRKILFLTSHLSPSCVEFYWSLIICQKQWSIHRFTPRRQQTVRLFESLETQVPAHASRLLMLLNYYCITILTCRDKARISYILLKSFCCTKKLNVPLWMCSQCIYF